MFTLRLQKDNAFTRFMNHPAPANSRYKPTCYEHAANCYTHAFLIVPAIVGSALLHRLSDDRWEKITAWMYGMGLCALFIVSTVFHIVSWKKSHLRTMEHCFHMCDRMMIYVFIAASYAPWLNLRELGPLASHMRWFIWLMAAGGTIYVFLYHENDGIFSCSGSDVHEQHRWTSGGCMGRLDILSGCGVLQERWSHSVCPCHLAHICGHSSCCSLLCHLEVPLQKSCRHNSSLMIYICKKKKN
ncbi:monocyte to macrophage differentiation factor isoform X2 [Aptenodytes patagonicus]|uniref:monocyte to macrophage differentiation factor isoform X2 n=1 Tax=Aptenodytes patagonicus TaxID=9234 RepID=UPI003FA0431C